MLNTYAPHMQYNKEEIDIYRGDVNIVTKTLPFNLIKIRCTVNNGKIARSSYNYDSTGGRTLGVEIE